MTICKGFKHINMHLGCCCHSLLQYARRLICNQPTLQKWTIRDCKEDSYKTFIFFVCFFSQCFCISHVASFSQFEKTWALWTTGLIGDSAWSLYLDPLQNARDTPVPVCWIVAVCAGCFEQLPDVSASPLLCASSAFHILRWCSNVNIALP